jgi:hypothetical protein
MNDQVSCYCGNELKEAEWKSTFVASQHYKSTTCDCGRDVRVIVSFGGSGHDKWKAGRKSGFEELVEKHSPI